MDCRQVLEELNNYVEGEMSAGLKEALQEHLAFCHKCEVVYNSTRQTLQIVADCNDTFEIPQDVSNRLYARLRTKTQAK